MKGQPVILRLVLMFQYQQLIFLAVVQHLIQIQCKVHLDAINNIILRYIHADQSNMFISVVFDTVTNSIACNFKFQTQNTRSSNKKKLCRIDYGPEEESCSSYSQTSQSISDMVRIGLPLQLSPTVRYCFTVTGSNSTHTAIVEGTFTPGHVNITQGNTYILVLMRVFNTVVIINVLSSILCYSTWTWTFPNVCDFNQFWYSHYSSYNHCALSSGI